MAVTSDAGDPGESTGFAGGLVPAEHCWCGKTVNNKRGEAVGELLL